MSCLLTETRHAFGATPREITIHIEPPQVLNAIAIRGGDVVEPIEVRDGKVMSALEPRRTEPWFCRRFSVPERTTSSSRSRAGSRSCIRKSAASLRRLFATSPWRSKAP